MYLYINQLIIKMFVKKTIQKSDYKNNIFSNLLRILFYFFINTSTVRT